MWLAWWLVACGSSPPTPVAAEPAPVAEPLAAPAERPVVTTVTPVTYQGVAWATAVERAVEHARERAHACLLTRPGFVGDVEVAFQSDAQGLVTGLSFDPPAVPACLPDALGDVRFPPASGEFPTLSTRVTWRFGTTAPAPDVDCVTDDECGLVTGGCTEPAVVARPAAARVDAENTRRLSVASCAAEPAPPVAAACVEGRCEAVPAGMSDMRGCTADAGCAVFERWCGWDTVAAARVDEARAIVRPEAEDLRCDAARPAAPSPRCIYGQCTLQWMGP